MMNSTTIQIPRKLTQQLWHLAQISPAEEICGLIGAKNDLPCSCYPIKNTAEQTSTQFLLDSVQQIAAMKTMREKGEILFAVYHSHPSAPALPSQTDIALNTQGDILQLIISLNTKGVLEMRGFRIVENAVEELMLSLAD